MTNERDIRGGRSGLFPVKDRRRRDNGIFSGFVEWSANC